MSGEIALWPKCAECTCDKGAWVPVEYYTTVDEPPKSFLCKKNVVVKVACSHGRGTRKWQHSVIEVPWWWGDAHERDAVASLFFFATGESSPQHGLVTRIN